MEKEKIHQHWKTCAKTHGTSLLSTTKTSTLKEMEVDALERAFRRYLPSLKNQSVLEMGCGNGHNCLSLAKIFPDLSFTGVDFVEEMVAMAKNLQASEAPAKPIVFQQGNVLELDSLFPSAKMFDVIFTDRCLINLNSNEDHIKGISQLANRLIKNGFMFLIENSSMSYNQQNHCRELVGLEKRTPAEYNLFFDESVIIPHFKKCGLKLIETEDFISLHDLVLYVLLPATNGGKIEYDHPLVKAATKLNRLYSQEVRSGFGIFGQNRLFILQKTN